MYFLDENRSPYFASSRPLNLSIFFTESCLVEALCGHRASEIRGLYFDGYISPMGPGGNCLLKSIKTGKTLMSLVWLFKRQLKWS